MSPFRYLVSPPDDLYTPLAVGTIDIDKPGSEHSISFENKYSGTHMVALVVNNPPPVGQDYEIGPLELSLVVSKNGNILMEKTVDQHFYPFWGHGKGYSGMALLNYEVPGDLPKNEILNFRITVLEGNAALTKKYENIRFLIGKISDE